ncbi:2Fe-2S iron-sulfur cluster-binding protein [Crenobacter sp. SG2303]|uniref:2Fe-2S iron-sulfur cluster-binding protein n=1 Tax=Crenobacter oryzisoli TaxID=3056844 RepID=A0ABT7XL94_9NEIS|nr:2Fe-2S iron-sulfur cluster-binding protein [Crenobacter sp. SG2303]MDN0074550.1 2Fe-2S iron-sulfur cluster-binding protein [Crenobacter sp. SG2303]
MVELATLCPHPMPVRAIRRETPDVWTLELSPPPDYRYLPGQYALVGIDGGRALRAYTLSSSPALNDFLSITVRRLSGGLGSGWLTGEVQVGDTLWLSTAQGNFTPEHAPDSDYLFLAGGCGVTPVMAITRWLLAHRPDATLVVLYHAQTPADLIFAAEWTRLEQRYPKRLRLHRLVDRAPDAACRQAPLSRELLAELVPDIARRTVMCCGPAGYMALAAELAESLGVPAERFHHEAFQAAAVAALDEAADDGVRHRVLLQPWGDEAEVAHGGNLLAALEAQQIPVTAACRSGQCGSCKVKVLEGDFELGEQSALSEAELADGYALACCCSVHGDLVIEGA